MIARIRSKIAASRLARPRRRSSLPKTRAPPRWLASSPQQRPEFRARTPLLLPSPAQRYLNPWLLGNKRIRIDLLLGQFPNITGDHVANGVFGDLLTIDKLPRHSTVL